MPRAVRAARIASNAAVLSMRASLSASFDEEAEDVITGRYSGSSINSLRRRGRASLTSTSSARRAPGPLVISAMRSESKIASSTSWVTMKTVLRLSVHIRISSSWMTPRVSASICANGSSASSNTLRLRSLTLAPARRAAACRRRSAAGRFDSEPSSPTVVIQRCTHALTWARVHPGNAARTASRMFSNTVIHGISEKFWKTTIPVHARCGDLPGRPGRRRPPSRARGRR